VSEQILLDTIRKVLENGGEAEGGARLPEPDRHTEDLI
jgi:hypothetical protein